MVAKKRASKRQTLQQKYKIIKRVKEHHKRLKKGVLIKNYKKKNEVNNIPNDWPYKAELLQEIAQAKEKMELVKQRQKEKRKETMVNLFLFLTLLYFSLFFFLSSFSLYFSPSFLFHYFFSFSSSFLFLYFSHPTSTISHTNPLQQLDE